MEQLVLLSLSIVKVSSARSADYFFLQHENVSNFSFFLSFFVFASKSSYLQVFANLYYHNKSGLCVSCNFYNNTKNNLQFHGRNNIVDGLHIQGLVVCTLVVSNLLLLSSTN